METSLAQLYEWLTGKEDEHAEFKEAKRSFNLDKLMQYCVAIANERGGRLILGVTDSRPRRIVGTAAFGNIDQTKTDILSRLRFRVDVEEVLAPDGRVIVFHIPSRPIGDPKQYEGTYLMRSGESLVPMTADMLQSIFAEGTPDFTASVCPGATLEELDPVCVE